MLSLVDLALQPGEGHLCVGQGGARLPRPVLAPAQRLDAGVHDRSVASRRKLSMLPRARRRAVMDRNVIPVGSRLGPRASGPDDGSDETADQTQCPPAVPWQCPGRIRTCATSLGDRSTGPSGPSRAHSRLRLGRISRLNHHPSTGVRATNRTTDNPSRDRGSARPYRAERGSHVSTRCSTAPVGRRRRWRPRRRRRRCRHWRRRCRCTRGARPPSPRPRRRRDCLGPARGGCPEPARVVGSGLPPRPPPPLAVAHRTPSCQR
jgi:hypothetical protein